MNSIRLTALTFAATLALTAVVSAEDAKPTLPPAAKKTGVTYATDIKPIFDASCVKCHSGDRPKARLKMDSLEGVLKGTKEGKIVTVGDSANSMIVKSVAHLTHNPDGWMPPLNNRAGIKPLTDEQIGLIRAWIDQGAK
jgi:mono/diheme cytochrome c family protein